MKSVTLKTRDNTADVTQIDGKTKYETGYPDNYEPRLIPPAAEERRVSCP